MTASIHLPSAPWDRMARKYAKRTIADQASYEATLERTRSYLRAGDTVLELGAGTSSTALLLAPLVGRYVSSDFSAEMVAIGREKLAAEPVANLEIVQGAPGDASLGAGPYDAVLAFNLMHLIPDLDGALKETARLIRPGGYFISKTPSISKALHMRIMIAVMRRIYGIPYVGRFEASELEERITHAGLEVIESTGFGSKGHSRYIVARKPG